MIEERTGCVVVGGGPAGMVLGLLMARAGVEVTVLEKHADFLRDFRGDTVHTSTMTLIDELGLWDRFAELPWQRLEQFRMELDAGPVTMTDYTRLRRPHPFIAMVPQWHFLDMLATAAEQEPSFTLVRRADVVDLLRDDAGRVTGVRYRAGDMGVAPLSSSDTKSTPITGEPAGGDGEVRELGADVVVACDGRDSRVRTLSGLPRRSFDVPMDVWWFRLPRGDAADPQGGLLRASKGRLAVILDRGDYFQCAYLIPRGADAEYRTQPIARLHDELRELYPWLGDRAEGVADWAEVKLLAVTLDRLRRWSAPGLLCIGDAAHAMSPVAGVGINLAVQDAVAAARYLAPVLGSARVEPAAVDRAAARVQRRRTVPTVVTQGLQRLLHRRVIGSALGSGTAPGAQRLPAPMRLLNALPPLRRLPAYVVGVGVLPEHAPQWATREHA